MIVIVVLLQELKIWIEYAMTSTKKICEHKEILEELLEEVFIGFSIMFTCAMNVSITRVIMEKIRNGR